MAVTSGARVKQLLEEALSRAPADRAGFLISACGDDEDLRREVESLAAAGEEAGAFLQTPAAPSNVSFLLSSVHADLTPGDPHEHARRFSACEVINGRYRVEHFAGEGGMGAVYRVLDTARSRTLALKTVRGGQTPFVNLFKLEFRTLVGLRHPYLAQSYDFEPIAGTSDYCFTMDFIEGRTILDATDGADWSAIVEFLVQLCRVLAYVHSRGVIHRDIKPNNVLVCTDGTLKLVDFGLVGSAPDGRQMMGTPAYLAPELLDGSHGDHRGDLYSLGVLAYQLLCRRLPFSGFGVADVLYQHAHETPVFPDNLDVPRWLRDVVLRLCAKQPADRFRGANEVIEAINRDGALSYPIETTGTREGYVLSGRFVGRDEEMQALSTHVERRLRDEGSATGPLLFIGGHSGVGKSRLVRELRHVLQVDRFAFVEGYCFEGAAAEYGAFAEAIVQLAALVDANGGGALIERHAGELAKIAPELGRGRAIAPSAPLISPEAERRRLLDTAAAFFIDATDFSPYVLSLDDLQWAPQGTVELLRYLLRRIALREEEGGRVPLAILGSYRDDEIADRPIGLLIDPPHAGTDTLRVRALEAPSMQRLLCSMFSLDDIPRTFVARVLDEAGGSPFFLEEVVRALVENGSVFVEDGAWHTTTDVRDLEIPASIVAAVRRRLQTVTGRGQQHILHLLAAHKKPMSVALLAAIAGDSLEDTQEALRALTVRNIVVPQAGAASTYRTAHDQVRTTVYADLGPQAAALHREIARALERLSAGEDRPLSELAYHYWLAQEHDEALRYALLAGRFALSVYANDEAIEHLEHALTLLPADRTPLRAEVTEQLADAHFLAGHYEPTKRLLAEVADTATGTTDRTRIQRKLGEVVGYSAGTPGEAVEILWTAAGQLGARRPATRTGYLAGTAVALGRHFLQQMLPSAREGAAPYPERTRLAELAIVYLRVGYFSFFADPLLFPLPVFRAANVVDRVGESREHCHVYSMMAITLAALGLSRRALRVAERAVAEAGRLGSPWHLANAHSFHAMVLLQTGRWPQAFENAERARDGFSACGDHFELAVSAYHLLEVLHLRGDLPAAKTRGRAELAIFERLGLQIIGKGVYTIVGRVLAKTGDERGVAMGRDVLARAERGADKLSTVLACVALGDALLHLGRVDEAIAQLERAAAIRDANGFNNMFLGAETNALLALAYGTQWRSAGGSLTRGAKQSFERGVAQAITAGRRFPPMRSSAALARGLRHRVHGRPRRAVACFDEAARLAAGLGAQLWEAEAHFESGLSLYDVEGRASAAGRASLEKALSLFRRCGARPAEQRAIQALEGAED